MPFVRLSFRTVASPILPPHKGILALRHAHSRHIIGGSGLSVTMRTPGHDFELAAGFLYGEGLIASSSDLHTVAYCTDSTLAPEQEFNVVTVELARPPRRTPSTRYDGPGAGSACGVCGKQSIDDVLTLGDGADP